MLLEEAVSSYVVMHRFRMAPVIHLYMEIHGVSIVQTLLSGSIFTAWGTPEWWTKWTLLAFQSCKFGPTRGSMFEGNMHHGMGWWISLQILPTHEMFVDCTSFRTLALSNDWSSSARGFSFSSSASSHKPTHEPSMTVACNPVILHDSSFCHNHFIISYHCPPWLKSFVCW